MKLEALQNRIDSLKQKIAKKQAIIEKKNKTIQKKEAELKKAGIDPSAEGFYEEHKSGGFREQPETSYIRILGGTDDPEKNRLYYIAAENYNMKEDIKRAERDIRDYENKLKEYEAQVGESESKRTEEDKILDSLPIEIKKMQAELIAAWDLDDEKLKEEILKDYEGRYRDGLDDERFVWAYYATKESIHKDNVEKSRELIFDLIRRTQKVVGDIKKWENLHIAYGTRFYPALNGIVHGTKGSARIHSIPAGGHNIQKLHVRVLVDKI